MIQDLVTLMRRSINDLSLSFINKAQENLEYVKNPLSMLDQDQSTPHKGLLDSQKFGDTQDILGYTVSAIGEESNLSKLLHNLKESPMYGLKQSMQIN